MLKKRLMGVVTVKDGWAVQSFGYQHYLPLGKPECLIKNLDRWGADEILLQVIDRSPRQIEPDFCLLKSIGKLGLSTPLIYGGGIRNVDDGIKVIQYGADRLAIDALLHDNPQEVQSLSEKLGAQAVIASMPLSWEDNEIKWLDYRTQSKKEITNQLLTTLESGIISEILIADWLHEGQSNSFEINLVQKFPLPSFPIIAFGGVSEATQMTELLTQPNVVAIAVGNFLNYQEQAIQKYKQAIISEQIRHPTYASKFSLLTNV